MKNLSVQITRRRIHFNDSSTTNNRSIIILVFLYTIVLPATAQSTSTISPENRNRFVTGSINHSMSIVLIALVCCFFCLGFIAFYIRHCTDNHSVGNTDDNTVATQITGGDGLDQELIEKFPIMVYSEVKGLKIDKVQLECAICLNEFQDYESLRLLTNCDHVFHPECIDVWLSSHVTCPVCRTVLKPENDKLKGRVDVVVVAVAVEQPVLNVSNSRLVISEEQNQIPIDILNPMAENRSPRWISNLDGKFPRSHSTGHSLVQSDGDLEKYTLRLPEEVRKQIEINSLQKKNGIVVWPKEESLRIGYTSSSGDAEEGNGKTGFLSSGYERSDQGTKSDRWVFMARPFLSKGGSSRSPKLGSSRGHNGVGTG